MEQFLLRQNHFNKTNISCNAIYPVEMDYSSLDINSVEDFKIAGKALMEDYENITCWSS